jgi:hypothetical protein
MIIKAWYKLLRQRYSALRGGHAMIKITSLPTIAGALLALGLSAAPAQAGPNRTWVSGTGTDSGACTRSAPCRTFAFALTQTAAGGEIDVLDPAGYGTVTITKAISIVNDGVGTAAIEASSGNAITINAGADSVHLRGLTIDGLNVNGGANGIKFKGENLEIENCVIRNFGVGIDISPSEGGPPSRCRTRSFPITSLLGLTPKSAVPGSPSCQENTGAPPACSTKS